VEGGDESRRWTARILIGLGTLLGAALLLAVSTLLFGLVSGSEFCPHTFKRRSFVYYEIPVLRIQAWPIRRDDATGSLERHLTTKRFLVQDKSVQPRWDLVQCIQAPTHVMNGDASILCNYLDANDAAGKLYWRDWTEKNQDRAKILWPAVADAARQQAYPLVPKLMRSAQYLRDPAELRAELKRAAAEEYRRMAESRQELADHAEAVRLYTTALKHDPSEAELLRGRAVSYQALGQDEKAAQDLAQAAQSSGAR
jgi:tetratricopeptide (TPR) repeat protein